jgi:hypothetical protein
MNEEEMIDALVKGAVLMVSDSGDVKVVALDDLPPAVRECFRASREHDWDHQGACPDCLEDEAATILMDAASHREDGNEATALELEAEAEALRIEAATIREKKTSGANRVNISTEPGREP